MNCPDSYGIRLLMFIVSGPDGRCKQALEHTITLEVEVKNSGEVDGKEVVQVYMSKSDYPIERAAQELKGFEKVNIPAGGTETVSIEIPVKELAYYNVDDNVDRGAGNLYLKNGKFSRNLLQHIEIEWKV